MYTFKHSLAAYISLTLQFQIVQQFLNNCLELYILALHQTIHITDEPLLPTLLNAFLYNLYLLPFWHST